MDYETNEEKLKPLGIYERLLSQEKQYKKFYPYYSLIIYSETNYELGISTLISVSSMEIEDLS